MKIESMKKYVVLVRTGIGAMPSTSVIPNVTNLKFQKEKKIL